MIKLIDRTLSCLDEWDPAPEDLQALLEHLLELHVDQIELSAQVCRKLKHLDPRGRYLLRLETMEEAAAFPSISRFVTRTPDLEGLPGCTLEIQMNDVGELGRLERYRNRPTLRVVGLDDLFLHNSDTAFRQLSAFGGRLELCPEDTCHCATAIAVEWLLHGGTYAVTAFGGIGGCPALEEVMLALRLEVRRRPNDAYPAFAQMRALLERMTGEQFGDKKAVIGRSIFRVESGIHVDGIQKDPRSYEAYPPELVGAKREVVLGAQSGRGAVAQKLQELGVPPETVDLPGLLAAIRRAPVVSSDMLVQLAAQFPAGTKGGIA